MRRDLARIAVGHERREREKDLKGMQVLLIGAKMLINRPIDKNHRALREKGLTSKVSQSLTFVRSLSGTRWLGDIQTSHNFGLRTEGRLMGTGER